MVFQIRSGIIHWYAGALSIVLFHVELERLNLTSESAPCGEIHVLGLDLCHVSTPCSVPLTRLERNLPNQGHQTGSLK